MKEGCDDDARAGGEVGNLDGGPGKGRGLGEGRAGGGRGGRRIAAT